MTHSHLLEIYFCSVSEVKKLQNTRLHVPAVLAF